ncbi:hypothetical protein AWC38_SpisGene24415 [Stylophora pistillata]|uniref:Uncharacterized protein n=1 Tax=Stylophora pistillata TaxID=50429 RepID=A0A2B4R4L3_STYPI|nr:hypothetical protein AWC38_SpisGene24415 [Stylophora pistillata]
MGRRSMGNDAKKYACEFWLNLSLVHPQPLVTCVANDFEAPVKKIGMWLKTAAKERDVEELKAKGWKKTGNRTCEDVKCRICGNVQGRRTSTPRCGCPSPLLGTIPNNDIIASAAQISDSFPHHARLSKSKAWAPNKNDRAP